MKKADFRTFYKDAHAVECLTDREKMLTRGARRRDDAAVRSLSRAPPVIPIYRPDMERLKAVVASIEHLVDEIVLVMDGDASVNFNHPKTRVVPNPSGLRTGYGKTVMRGGSLTNSWWLLFLNDDCYLGTNAVSAMISAADNQTAIVGCLLRYPNGLIQHGGTMPSASGLGWRHIDVGRHRL